MQLAETEVAMGDEGAHRAVRRDGEGLVVMVLSLLRFERVAVRCDVTEQAECQRLLSTPAVIARRREGLLGETATLRDAAGEEVDLAEQNQPARLPCAEYRHRAQVFQSRQDRHAVADASG